MMRDVIAKILSTGPWVRRASLAGLGASLLPSLSFGLGLGDIQVESRLNQPLYARVEVVDVSDDDWRQIRTRIAPRILLSEGLVHPEILASLTLRAVEDGKGRHFIEVKSGEVLAEPLFDLPVEVAGQSLQVVRDYSVLLDPATSEDAPQGTPAGEGGTVADTDAAREVGRGRDAGRLAVSGEYVAAAQVDAQAHTVRRHRAHRALAAAAAATTATGASGREPLEGQLATLQQTVTKLQATIASQDGEIAKLNARIAARGESPVLRRPSTWVEYPARKAQTSSDEGSDARFGWFGARSAMFCWIGGAIAGIFVLAFGVVSFLRWRHARMLREIALNEAARRQSPPKPAVAPTSERDLLAWQSNLRESALAGRSSRQSSAPSAAPAFAPSASEDTVAVTVAVEELTQDLEADLESLNASYEAEHLENASGGMVAWRAQNEMLEREYLADTEVRPYVVEPGNQVKSIGRERELPAADVAV